MKKIIFMAMALMGLMTANAQVTLSVDELTIAPGETKALTINLDNTVDVNGFQFDLFIPEGMAIGSKKPYKPELSERAENHSITSKAQETGATRFMVVSMENEVIEPGSGEIMTIYLTAAADAPTGTFTLDVTGITISHSGSQKLVLDNTTWTCNVGTATSIASIGVEADTKVYNANGMRTDKMQHGINIVKTAKGVKKVVK